MDRIAIVYWSGRGATKQMADYVKAGVEAAGKTADVYLARNFGKDLMPNYNKLAFGCPAMGNEELEPSEFEPMFREIEPYLPGKKVVLFGSYGWGDGEWMRDWTTRMEAAGATVLNGEGLICHETPDEDGLNACRELGRQLADA